MDLKGESSNAYPIVTVLGHFFYGRRVPDFDIICSGKK